MTRARAGLLLLGVFLFGAVSGAFATGAVIAYRFRHGGPPPERVERLAVQRLARRLDLDATQQRALEQIADRARARIAEVRSEALPKVESILDEAHRELRPSLRPEQQRKLDRIREEARQRLRVRGGGSPAR